MQHVRISNKGWKLLNDRELANKVARAIVDGKEKLQTGEPINVEQGKVSIQMVTSIKKDVRNDENEHKR